MLEHGSAAPAGQYQPAQIKDGKVVPGGFSDDTEAVPQQKVPRTVTDMTAAPFPVPPLARQFCSGTRHGMRGTDRWRCGA